MKATIKPIITYQVTINGDCKGEFKKTGELSGMLAMERGNKEIVVDVSMGNRMCEAVGIEFDADIVKASPSLLDKNSLQ